MSESKKRCNGWSSYETWAVALWTNNDEGSQSLWDESAEEAYRVAVGSSGDGDRETWTHEATSLLADKMEGDFGDEELCPLFGQSSVYADLLNAAIEEVDWYEIAASFIDNVEKADIEKELAEVE